MINAQDTDNRGGMSVEDQSIIELYFRRSERAISETEAKYGGYCGAIASNILTQQEDAEECLNDTWLAAWNDIPPSRPNCLRAYLGRLTRNLAITRYRYTHAEKRRSGMDLLLSELEDSLPAPVGVEQTMEQAELSRILRDWLDDLAAEDRKLFIRRYWYGVSVKSLAAEAGTKDNLMAQRLLRLRRKLKQRLEQEGEFL